MQTPSPAPSPGPTTSGGVLPGVSVKVINTAANANNRASSRFSRVAQQYIALVRAANLAPNRGGIPTTAPSSRGHREERLLVHHALTPVGGDKTGTSHYHAAVQGRAISIVTTFRFGTARMDFRVEAVDLFNRVVWGSPNTNFSSSQFGVISSQANSPRRMQFGLKLYW